MYALLECFGSGLSIDVMGCNYPLSTSKFVFSGTTKQSISDSYFLCDNAIATTQRIIKQLNNYL